MIRTITFTFQKKLEFVENSNLEDFIKYAKQYNIFQNSTNKIYNLMCEKIKARLDREGLSYDTVRPD